MSARRRPRQLRPAPSFSPRSPWQRSLVRVKARGPLNDPLGKGILAVSMTLMAGLLGLWTLVFGDLRLAALAFGLAAIEGVIYLALTVRAFKRDKAVQFWQERRRLRLDLGREAAYRQLLLYAFFQLDHLQRESQDDSDVEEALRRMVHLTYSVFAPAQDELAVLLVREGDGRCEIVHSALGQGSRWHALRKGKHCKLEGPLKERLESLSPHHYAQKISTSTFPLWLVVLHDAPLTRAEVELLHQMPRLFESIVNQKRDADAYPDLRPLRVVRSV